MHLSGLFVFDLETRKASSCKHIKIGCSHFDTCEISIRVKTFIFHCNVEEKTKSLSDLQILNVYHKFLLSFPRELLYLTNTSCECLLNAAWSVLQYPPPPNINVEKSVFLCCKN